MSKPTTPVDLESPDIPVFKPNKLIHNVTLFHVFDFIEYDRDGTFDLELLRKAYHQKLRKFHPDKVTQIDPKYNYTVEEANTVAQKLQRSFHILSIPHTHAEYIEEGHDAFSGKLRKVWTTQGWAAYRGKSATRFDLQDIMHLEHRLKQLEGRADRLGITCTCLKKFSSEEIARVAAKEKRKEEARLKKAAKTKEKEEKRDPNQVQT